jgi:hypothetical protein
MVFLKVNEKDPMAELCQVWTCPFLKRTGHGENAERKSNEFRRLRHLPKYGHGRGELKVAGYRHNLRTEGRYNFVAAPAFVPMFMHYQPPKAKVARIDAVLKQPTLFERYLAMRRK